MKRRKAVIKHVIRVKAETKKEAIEKIEEQQLFSYPDVESDESEMESLEREKTW